MKLYQIRGCGNILPEGFGKMIVRYIVGLTAVMFASILIVGCGTPPPVLSSMALPQNMATRLAEYAQTPEPDTPITLAVAIKHPDLQPTLAYKQNGVMAGAVATPLVIPQMQKDNISTSNFKGTFLNKVEAAKFLTNGVEVTVLNVGENYFDIQTAAGEQYRIESPVKPKYVDRYINEYGLSDIRRIDGVEKGLTGILKSSQTPENIMGVGPNVIGVTPEASDGVEVADVIPVFTLSSPAIEGPNDYVIKEEMDYTVSIESSSRKRWFEIYKGLLKGIIWQIFEQSNRYFTMIDKREWDRFTPGYIFSLMEQFEYLIPIPDRIMNIRNPKERNEEEKMKNRYVLHDYSIGDTSVRVLIPTFDEIKKSEELKRVRDGQPSVGYLAMTASLTDAELGDGEKFTWNSPVKVTLYVEGKQFVLYMPLNAGLEVDGKMYHISKSQIH